MVAWRPPWPGGNWGLAPRPSKQGNAAAACFARCREWPRELGDFCSAILLMCLNEFLNDVLPPESEIFATNLLECFRAVPEIPC
eukprot:3842366-Pyramimonas_sp.AAC.1